MKKLITVLFSVLMLLALAACGGGDKGGTSTESSGNDGEGKETASTGETKTIRIGIGLNDTHPLYKGSEKFKEIVEEKTGGELIVELYHSGQLGDDRTMTEALQLGSQEVTIPSTSPLANFIPEYSIFDFPFLMPSVEVADAVLDGEVGQKFLDMLEEQNLVGLAYWENGYRDITNDKHAIATAEDFKGLKIRTMENEVHLDAFRELGANPTPMAMTELFTALQQGTVDGQENPLATIYLQKLYEVQGHVSNTNHVYTPFVFLMSKPFYDDLTEEQQVIVREAAVEAGVYERQLLRDENAETLEALKAEGITYTEITPEVREEMKEIVQPIIDKYTEKLGPELVKEVYDAIEAASK